MFVAIDNTEMNVYQVDKWIKDTRNANRDIITPEFAMEVLSKTNHLANIKMVLKNIRENCDTPEKIAPYREFILSCADGREMSEQAIDMLQEMAKLCGCEDELETINNVKKLYSNKDVKGVIVRDLDKLNEALNSGAPVFIDVDKNNAKSCFMAMNGIAVHSCFVSIQNKDFSNVKAIRAKGIGSLGFKSVTNLPTKLVLDDVYGIKVMESSWADGADVLDIRDCGSLLIEECKNVPENIDASNCKTVAFKKIDLSNWDKIKFGDDVDLRIQLCKNVPESFDVSFVSRLGIYGTDISKAKDLRFRDGANVVMDDARIGFNTEIVTVVPESLDFSNCDKVTFNARPLEVKEVRFKNKKQAGDWVDKMVYLPHITTIFTDEENAKKEKLIDSAPINNGFDM